METENIYVVLPSPLLLVSIPFYSKFISPEKLIELFFWQNIMKPSMTHPTKRFIIFSTILKQVWSEKEIIIVKLCLQINWCRLHFAHWLWTRLAKTHFFTNIFLIPGLSSEWADSSLLPAHILSLRILSLPRFGANVIETFYPSHRPSAKIS
jgi:hypothetical protein